MIGLKYLAALGISIFVVLVINLFVSIILAIIFSANIDDISKNAYAAYTIITTIELVVISYLYLCNIWIK